MRNRAIIDKIINKYLKGPTSGLSPYLRNILRISVYQYLFLERIPAYAIVNEGVKLAYRQKDKKFINAVLRKIIQQEKKSTPDLLIRNWLTDKIIKIYGEKTGQAILQSFSTRPRFCLRVNRLRTTREEILALLESLGIQANPGHWLDEHIIVDRLGPIRHHSIVKEGLVSIQDEAEGLVAHLLGPKEGETVIDFCAGPGGKAGHLAELMSRTGMVIAFDIDPEQLRLVAENRNRLKHTNIYPVLADSRKVKNLDADRILIDAPCSNLGTVCKRPEIIDRLKPEDFSKLARLQLELLDAAASNLKSGGILIYSTCTIMPAENEEVIKQFLDNHNFEIEPAHQFLPPGVSQIFLKILPHQFRTDGVFAVRMKKK